MNLDINKKVLTKNKSLSIKFIAVVLMVILHTFAFPNRISDVEYISIFNINGVNIEYIVASFGAICVGMFLFLSGYGLYISYGDNVKYKEIIIRIKRLYINFWVIFSVFIPIGILKEVYGFSINRLLLSFIGLKDYYNGEWWFLRLYVFLILLYPLIIGIVKRYNKDYILAISFLLNIIGYGLTKFTYALNIDFMIIEIFNIVLGGQFLFICGVIVAKYNIFEKIKLRLNFSKIKNRLLLIVIVLIITLTINISVIGEVLKLILIPVFIFALSECIPENTVLSKLGKHSTNIWLTHSFFCYYLFQEFTFLSKLSILIILQLLIVTVLISVVINKLLKIIYKYIN